MASPASEGSANAGCSRRRSGALRSLVAVCALTCCGFRCAGAAFSIPEEAQVLAAQMKRLSAQELGVFAMQDKADHGFCRGSLGRRSPFFLRRLLVGRRSDFVRRPESSPWFIRGPDL